MPEQFANAIGTDPTLNGAISTTPAAGTVETWTLSATGATTTLPQRFPYSARVDDSASTADSPFEIVHVTGHPSSTTATVKRGMGGTASKAHANGATFRHTVTAGALRRAFGGIGDLRRTGAIAETLPRVGGSFANALTLSSGRLHLVALSLPKDDIITSITFLTGSVAVATATNQWFGLFDDALAALAFTTNDTTAAWTSSAEKTLNLSAPFTTTYAGLYYIGVMVTATTMPNLHGPVDTTAIATALAPVITGFSSTGQTAVPALPFTAAALTVTSGHPWAYVS